MGKWVGLIVILAVFPRVPQQDEKKFTIYIIGGSTSAGTPYNPRSNYGKMVSFLLGHRLHQKQIVIKNLAKGGAPSSRVKEQATRIGDDASLVLLYSGHNEFIVLDGKHYDRPLPLVGHPLPYPFVHVLADYESNLRELVISLKKRNIPLIMSTLVSNMADWEPNRSTILRQENKDFVTSSTLKAEQSLKSGHLVRAKQLLKSILKVEPEFAWAHFQLAGLYRREKNYEKANKHYILAKDFDRDPSRVLTRQNDFLVALAREKNVALIRPDLEFVSRGRSVPGYDLFWDNVHPNLQGAFQLASLFEREIREQFNLNHPKRKRTLKDYERTLNMKVALHDAYFRSTRGLLVHCLIIWNYEARFRKAKEYYSFVSSSLAENEKLKYLAVIHTLSGDISGAKDYWTRLFKLDNEFAKETWENPIVQNLNKRFGLIGTYFP